LEEATVADRVYVVGVGAEGYSGLSPRAREILDAAEAIFGVERLLETIPTGRAARISGNPGVAKALSLIESTAGEGGVAVIASGDPGFFGIGKLMVRRFGRGRVEIIPHVSSVQLAFAAVGESWEDASFLSVHGRSIGGLVEAVERAPKVAIFTDGINSPSAVAKRLLAAGVRGRRAFLCEEMGGPKERVRQMKLAELAGMECSPLSVLILLPDPESATAGVSGVQSPRSEWPLGIPDEEFQQRRPRRGLITKLEVRLAALGKMGLTSRSVVWDVGAGSGAVSIEAAGIAREGQVYAVERDEEGIEIIRANLATFGCRNVVVVPGSAPEALEGLPAPDAVFVGGSGGKLSAILDLVGRRLRPNGRVVVNAATLETVGAALAHLREMGFAVESTLIQVSRGKGLGEGLTHFEALDPVFIVAGRRS